MSIDPDLCTCGYTWSEHPERTIEDRGNGAWRGMIGNARANPKCKCTTFRPRTNLDYLEEKYDERNKQQDQ